MLDLKTVGTEEVQMTAQTEEVGIVELSDSDLESIVGGLACACRSASCCRPPGEISIRGIRIG